MISFKNSVFNEAFRKILLQNNMNNKEIWPCFYSHISSSNTEKYKFHCQMFLHILLMTLSQAEGKPAPTPPAHEEEVRRSGVWTEDWTVQG